MFCLPMAQNSCRFNWKGGGEDDCCDDDDDDDNGNDDDAICKE